MLDTSRRGFLRAALFVAAAPIIVKAANIMPVRVLVRAPKLVDPRNLLMRVVSVALSPITGSVDIHCLDHMGLPVVRRVPYTEFVDRPPIKGFENATRIVGLRCSRGYTVGDHVILGRPFGGSTVDDVLVGREITKDPHTGKLIIT